MPVDLHVGTNSFEIGAPSFFASFFSTVFKRLEPAGWGTRFPNIMNRLYSGELPPEAAPAALEELRSIRNEFENHPPSAVVWNHEDPSAHPPWGENISPHITSLGNYFVTSDGKDLFGVVEKALSLSADQRVPVRIQ